MDRWDEIVESDRRYFALGAERVALDGACVYVMPGLAHLPAGCTFVLSPEVGPNDIDEVAAGVERAVLAHGGRSLRTYTCAGDERRAALQRAGFETRHEVVYVRDRRPVPPAAVTLRPVDDEADWISKRALHDRTPERPDGHAASAQEWTELERRKAAAGGLRPYLAEIDGDVCGAVATMATRTMLRLKNLVVEPSWRRQGIGLAIVDAIAHCAARDGKRGMGVLGVEGSSGARLYERAGLRAAGCHLELTKCLA